MVEIEVHILQGQYIPRIEQKTSIPWRFRASFGNEYFPLSLSLNHDFM